MDDRVINIFLEDGQKREYLVNSKHTVERIKAVVAKDHEPTFGSTVSPSLAKVHAAGDYTLSVVTFYADCGEFTMRDLEREKDKILLYILFPDENPSRQSVRRSRSSKRVAAAAAAAAAASQRPSKIRYELLYHRSGVAVDLGERKFAGMFVPRSTHRKADLINHLTVRIANPDKTGNLRKFSEKRKKWEKKYFMLKNGILWSVCLFFVARRRRCPRLAVVPGTGALLAVCWLLCVLQDGFVGVGVGVGIGIGVAAGVE